MHHNTQPTLISSRVRVFHLEVLKKETWSHSFGFDKITLMLEINHVTKQPSANCLNKCRPPSRHSKGQKLNSYKQLANLAWTYFMLKVLTLIRKKCPGLSSEPHPKLLGFHEISYIPIFLHSHIPIFFIKKCSIFAELVQFS